MLDVSGISNEMANVEIIMIFVEIIVKTVEINLKL